MTPDPIPVLGRSVPNAPLSPAAVVVVIFTTAGPAFAAASITAEDSSIETGCWAVVWRVDPVGVVDTWWSKAPVRSRIATVPPAASTADRNEAVTTVPIPARPFERLPPPPGPPGGGDGGG